MTTAWKVDRSEIEDLNAHDQRREERLTEILALKARRRVQVGDRVSLHFECKDTVLFQIQEMLRIERIYEEARIREEIETYNDIMPAPNELSATLFIEITSQDRVEPELNTLLGLEECLWMEIGQAHRLKASFEAGHSREDRISAVHYVRFKLSAAQADAMRAGQPVVMTIDHAHYHARVDLPSAQVQELAKDLGPGDQGPGARRA